MLRPANLIGRFRDPRLAFDEFLALDSPLCVALNRGRGRRQESVETLLDDGVAFARCLLEAETIQDLNPPTTIADNTGRLHRLRGKRYRFPIGAQNMRQEFVRVRQGFAIGLIMHHE